MNKLKQKIISGINLLAVTVTTILVTVPMPVSYAAWTPEARDLCTTMVKPFDVTKVGTNDEIISRKLAENATPAQKAIHDAQQIINDSYINYLRGNACNIVYGQSIAQPLNSNSFSVQDNPDASTKHMPITRHDHTYYNDSTADRDFYYMSTMDQFVITLQPDGGDPNNGSIIFNEIKCQTPYPRNFLTLDAANGVDQEEINRRTAEFLDMEDCNNTHNDATSGFPQLYGGTTVSKAQVGNTVVITWKFAQNEDQNGNHSGRPIIWGNNGDGFKFKDEILNFETDNAGQDNLRKEPFNVHLPSKDKDQIWSATTTSKALVQDLFISQTGYNKDLPFNNWEAINSANQNVARGGIGTASVLINDTPNPDKTELYYWFPIGSVATVWKEKPPVIPPKCVDMTMQFKDTNINGKTGQELWIDSIAFADENNDDAPTPEESLLRWTAPESGEFYTKNAQNRFVPIAPASVANNKQIIFTARDKHVFYVNPGAQDVQEVEVSLVPGENKPPYSDACFASTKILPQANICESITLVKDPAPVQIEGEEAYKFNVSTVNFSGATPAEAQVQWSAPSTGKFYTSFGGFRETDFNIINNTKLTVPLPINFPVYYVNPSNNPQQVTAILVDANRRAYDLAKCSEALPVAGKEEAPPLCAELKVDHPRNIFEQTLSTFRGQSINDQDPAAAFNEGKIRYTVEAGYGSFFKEDPELTPVNQSEMILETFAINGIMGIMENFGILNNVNWNIRPAANNGFDLSNGFASTLLASFIPGPQLAPDLSGVDLGQAVEPLQREPIAPVNVGIQHPAFQTIDAAPGEKVWFFADKASNNPADNVIHVEQLDKAGKPLEAICKRDFPISPFSTCESLKVNHDLIINEQKITSFETKALDNQDRDFGGKITYSVDAGYGRFYTHDPTLDLSVHGYTPNDSERAPQEFDPSIAINAPAGGFCEAGEINQGFGGVLKPEVAPAVIDATATPTPTPAETTPTTTGPTTTLPTYDGTLTLPTVDITPDNTPTTTIKPPISIGTIDTPTYVLPDSSYDLSADVYIPSEVIYDLNPEETINVITNIATGDLFKPQYKAIYSPYKPEFNYIDFGGNNSFNIQQNFQNQIDLQGNVRELNSSLPVRLNLQGLAQRANVPSNDFSYETITVDPGTKIWFVAKKGGEKVIHVTTACTEAAGCTRDFSIKPAPPTVCKDFGMEVDPSAELKVGENADIRLNPTDQNGNALPNTTKIVVTQNTTGGELITVRNPAIQNHTLGDFPATLQGTDQAGTFTLAVDPASPIASPACQGTITVTEGIAPECKALTYILKEYFNENQVNTLKENNFYEVNSDVNVINEAGAQQVTYTIDPNYGAFVTLPSEEQFLFDISTFIIKNLATTNNATRQTLEANFGAENVNSVTTVTEGTTVYLVTFTDTPGVNGLNANILTIKAQKFGNVECQKSVPLEKEKKEIAKECLDLEIVTPESPWEIDANDNSQLFQINVHTNPADYRDDLFYHWEVTRGSGEWVENSDDTLVADRDKTQTLENFDQDTRVSVYATDTKNGEKINSCSDSISATIKEEKEKPKISKYVAPLDKVDDKDTILNIGETRSTQFVTYLVAFTPGGSKAVEIWEDTMRADKIKSKNDLDGVLELDQMSINILSENNRNSYAFMRSDNYRTDHGDTSYADVNFEYDSSRKIFCNEDNMPDNQFCIENADNVEELQTMFGNGEHIQFKNVDKLKTGDQIIIKYRALNKSKVDNESCKNLSAANGCGEEFDNTIKFRAYEDNDFKKEFENGKDSAKVIVICPYVITRGGGDTFFHDIVDTGADVAKCSEVKSCEGVCITPPREKPAVIPSTGAGEISADLQLTLPSHDICKYSNSEANIEGYNDVLKNFSSTVCEVRSEVASIWKEKNINNSIAANIERLARFGSNLNPGNLNTDVDNKQSGVFISDGNDITIGEKSDTTDEYIIQSGNGIPAAQTYIIKDADLYINSDIKYGDTDFTDQNQIPSVAFIVINGNIIIDDSVEYLDGIYMAVNLNGAEGQGKVTNAKNFDPNNTTDTSLSIYGNLIGDVYELFATRKGYGDPTKDEGSVVVHYDSRILLNTPPGISELVDVDQSLVPG